MKFQAFRPILLVNGILLMIVAAVMLLPAMVDYSVGNDDWRVFAVSALGTGFIGGSLYLTNRGYRDTLSLRQTFMFTVTSYVFTVVATAVPMHLSPMNMSFADAIFEASSGLTTTGSSVLTGLDSAPPGILLWRALLNAMGGIGIVVLALAILPMLRIGGMQLFRTESSDTTEKMLPRATQLAAVISAIFGALVLACAFCFYIAGMSGFDAICHAMATIATGGFSTHDASFGYYDSPTIEFICIVFMCAGSLPLILYFRIFRGDPGLILRDTQVRVFFIIVLCVTATLAIWLSLTKEMSLLTALRYSSFNVVSVISTTGFATADYGAWGNFSICVFFMLLPVGGCTGSTAGGIKIFRFQIFYETTRVQLRQLLQPNGVFVPRYNGKPITDSLAASVMSFFLLFALTFMVVALILSLYGLDFLTSMSSSAQALANVGPGLGQVVGPAGNFSSLPDGAKWVLSFAMILGRVELFTFLVLFTPAFWRD